MLRLAAQFKLYALAYARRFARLPPAIIACRVRHHGISRLLAVTDVEAIPLDPRGGELYRLRHSAYLCASQRARDRLLEVGRACARLATRSILRRVGARITAIEPA